MTRAGGFKAQSRQALCNKSGAKRAAKKATSSRKTAGGSVSLSRAGSSIKIALTESGIFALPRGVFGRRRVSTTYDGGSQ
jgi:hypothetical protein